MTFDDDWDVGNGTLFQMDALSDERGWITVLTYEDPSARFDISVGQCVTVSQAGSTKTLRVAPVSIAGVDEEREIIWGWADPGAFVQVMFLEQNLHPGIFRRMTADPQGRWSADFSVVGLLPDEGVADFGPGDYGIAAQIEANGCSTDTEWIVGETGIEGATRFETAVAASREAYPYGASCVVITTGFNWPDALGGAALADANRAPILLTEVDEIPDCVWGEIVRLGASEAIILGGPQAVSSGVEGELRSRLGAGHVTRLGGSSRYETAELIAKATVAALDAYDGTAIVTTGLNYPDAVATSALAAANGWPIFLVSEDGLLASTRAVMTEIGVERVVIPGGTVAVSAAVEQQLISTYGAANVTRLAGDDRYETAVEVAAFGAEETDMVWNGVAIATGEDFPDALTGGVLQGRNDSVLLLSPSIALDDAPAGALSANDSAIWQATFLGGTSALSTAVREEVSDIIH